MGIEPIGLPFSFFYFGCAYLQAGGRAYVYNFWSDAKAAADFIYNPAHYAGTLISNHSISLCYVEGFCL